MSGDRRGLVIFDCDGVLVDSEPIAITVLREFLGRLGVEVSEAYAYERFLGRSWPTVVAHVAREFGRTVTDDEAAAMRAVLFQRFRAELQPMPGIEAVLDRLELPACVASSSVPERLRLSLETTGLLRRFDPHVFSASLVGRGKPAPDLFLHAAGAMGFEPRDCVVIEDSPTGVEAARNAGMTVLAFVGGAHAGPGRLLAGLEACRPDAVFADMGALADLIADWRRAG